MSEHLIIPTANESVTLRELTVEDAQAYFEAVDNSRAHLSQFGDTTAEKYPDVASVVDSIEHPIYQAKKRFGIWDRDQFVGSINLSPSANLAEIGYWVDQRYTGHGYASTAANALARYAKEQGFTTVMASVHEDNLASQGVMRRAGFNKKRQEDEFGVYHFALPLAEMAVTATVLYDDDETTIARITLSGKNQTTINHRSTTTYKVVEGRAKMVIDGVRHELLPGSEVTVPVGTPYWDEGEAVMIATSKPPFGHTFVEVLSR